MVAAWISAETGVGPSIASQQPGLQRELRRLAAGAEQQQQADRGDDAAARARAPAPNTPVKLTVPKVANISMIASDSPTSPTRLTMNAFLAAVAAVGLVLPEPDQQVRREADALPARVQHQVVVGQHQQQHRGDEQVQVAEEPAPLRDRAPCSRPSRCGSASRRR